MILKSISIQNFRNYESEQITLDPGVNILYGKNAQGKTNLLESIYVLGVTKSHRSFIDNNLIKNDCSFARIQGIVNTNNIDTKYEIKLENKNKQLLKNLSIDNDEVKKVSDYISNINIIIFYPEDLEIIKSSPMTRRKFINSEISQIYNSYYRVLFEYNYLMKNRNEFLKKMNKDNMVDKIYYDKITDHLINKAVFIYKARIKFIDKLNLYCRKIYKKIANQDGLKIIYKSNIAFSDFDEETIKTKLKEEYQKNLKKEMIFGTTLIGPHRDDIEFHLNDINLKEYGSQGQQRIAIIATKLAEIEIVKIQCKTNPILLLDDVFSELDIKKHNNLLQYINNNIQTIITTTDLSNLNEKLLKEAKIFVINNNKITIKRKGGTHGKK